jgi:hypothetical protein
MLLSSVMRRSPFTAVVFVLAGQIGAQDRHWVETRSETIWHGRYTNCDKGWAVDLPRGVLAHGSLPPNPEHGFLISATNPGTTDEVTADALRVIDVYDEYDAMEFHTARAYLDWELKNTESKVVLDVRGTVLQGLHGIQAKYRVKSSGSEQIVESLIFLRRDIVYHLLLRTTDQYYKADSALFSRIRAGFRMLPIPKGECVNP